MNLTQKIIGSHLVSGTMTPGSEIGLRIDQTLTQDATGTMAWLQFEALGIPRVKTDISLSYVDHNTLQMNFRNPDDHRFLRTVAAKFGGVYSGPGTGICHIYVDRRADQEMALNIVENAKCSRPSVCNAAEVCLVDRAVAGEFLPKLRERLVDHRSAQGAIPVELRLDQAAAQIISGTHAGPEDFDTEFLDYVLAVKVVDGVDAAVAHIAAHSTGHSDAIVTADEEAAQRFLAQVDSAAVYWNASTRFTDGGEFGLGCEMGISTQKLHARGPMGLAELCTYKYVVRGTGQVR